jgi:hypothetical protein
MPDVEGEIRATAIEAVAVGDQVIAAEVAAVGDALEDHAELSEERHEEILEDTQWLRNQLELIQTMFQSVQQQLTALQAAMLAELAATRTLLTASTLSTPQQETPPVVEEAVIVVETPPEPVSGEEDRPVAETPAPAPAPEKRRRFGVI